jgi:hypothetical protein
LEAAVPVADSEPIGIEPRPKGGSRLGRMTAGLRDFGRRRRALITVFGSLVTAVILAFLLAGRRHEFAGALSSGAAAWVLAVTVLLQIVALLARSDAWHLCIRAAGGRSTAASSIARRACRSWAASSTGSWGLRRGSPLCSSPTVSPQVPR